MICKTVSLLESLTTHSPDDLDFLVEYFDKEENNIGAIVSNLSEGHKQSAAWLASLSEPFATLAAGLVVGLVYTWKVGLVGLACVPFLMSTGYIRLVGGPDPSSPKAHEDPAQLACEAAGAIRTVASLTREDDYVELYSKSLEEPLRHSNQTAIWSNLLYSLSQSFVFFVISLVFWYGSRLVSYGEFTTKQFFTVDGLWNYCIQAGNVFTFVPDKSLAHGTASDIIHLLDARPDIDAKLTDGQIPQSVKGHIRFQDVHFRYPTRPGVCVLRGLNIFCGTWHLVERFYDPLSGNVLLDDEPISELNVQEYRKHIVLVSQEPVPFTSTSTKPMAEVTQEEIEDACRDANILDFVKVSPRATSALDSNSEKVVQAALDEAARGRTTIAIAHRLSTIQNAGCIYFIKDGVVSESGTHDELFARGGDYYEYVQLQGLNRN
ncbi:P-loop containing nucleoside triphosphate hydrolase protein [Lactifluus subvellereus]|nr:P-loop containing nucleoside triphosphate hydrolase protein [Lactifluus subvellereus]